MLCKKYAFFFSPLSLFFVRVEHTVHCDTASIRVAGGSVEHPNTSQQITCLRTAEEDQWGGSLNKQAFVVLPLLICTGKTRVIKEQEHL